MQQSLFGSILAQPEAASAPASLRDMTLSEAIFTVVDVETTGLSAKKNALTEITAIRYRNSRELGMFSTLVKPTEEIPPEVETLTGITNEMVRDASPLITVLSELCAFVGANPIIVGHNVGFDIRFLSEKIQQAGLSAFTGRFDPTRAACTKILAQKALPGLPSYEGMVVATQCNVVNPNPHRAEADVRMSAGILFSLIDRLKTQGMTMTTVQDLLDYQGPLS